MIDPLRHHREHRTTGVFGDSLAERMAEKVADGMGTVKFLVISTTVIVAWTVVNHLASFLTASWTGLLNGKGFDPAPFILLNLMFSAVAFYTGALVIIAQKAQSKRDRQSEEASARHRQEESDRLVELLQHNTDLTAEVEKLTREVHELVAVGKTDSAEARRSPKGSRRL